MLFGIRSSLPRFVLIQIASFVLTCLRCRLAVCGNSCLLFAATHHCFSPQIKASKISASTRAPIPLFLENGLWSSAVPFVPYVLCFLFVVILPFLSWFVLFATRHIPSVHACCSCSFIFKQLDRPPCHPKKILCPMVNVECDLLAVVSIPP